ncbi:hypothetical protein [Enterobacter roggenkampii]|uniref:hypothetical protein n=1 Tax=Enterobacter roggenkampii TaxID=1812935 RepID=UPI002A7FCCED|nr:hypothetical protein [Enterobacter roggenkampii]
MPITVLQLLPVFSPHQAQWILLFPNNKDSVNLDIPNNEKVFIVIAELAAAMSAIKETTGLIKVINDAKTDAEIKAATFELQAKLLTLQSDCFSLGEAIQLKDDKIHELKSQISAFDSFKEDSKDYFLTQTAAGSFVYSMIFDPGDGAITLHACPACFRQAKLSLLQPSSTTHSSGGFFVHYCPSCKSDFKMDRVPPMPPVQMPRRLKR